VNLPALPDGVRGSLRGLRHVGIVTDDSEALTERLQALFGVADSEITRVPPPGTVADTRFAFFSIGGLPLEIIEPVSARFRALLLGSGRGVNHVCFNVEDLPAAVAAMRAHGVRLGHVTADGIVDLPHARMAYFDPEDTAGVLIEFVEPRQ
jgi:catechol 2,3-dioxygenase-like lactoylglutathione lyase family enzyme